MEDLLRAVLALALGAYGWTVAASRLGDGRIVTAAIFGISGTFFLGLAYWNLRLAQGFGRLASKGGLGPALAAWAARLETEGAKRRVSVVIGMTEDQLVALEVRWLGQGKTWTLPRSGPGVMVLNPDPGRVRVMNGQESWRLRMNSGDARKLIDNLQAD